MIHTDAAVHLNAYQALGDVAEIDDVPDGGQVVGAHVFVLQVCTVHKAGGSRWQQAVRSDRRHEQ